MRRLAPLLAAAVLAAGCGEAAEPPAAAPTVTTPTVEVTEPVQLPGATCEEQEGGESASLPDFVRVDLESDGGVDRVTFRFRQSDPEMDEPPAYIVRYVDELRTDGEGAPVEVEGEAFVAISFQAVGVDLTGEEFVEVYTGPKTFTPRFPTVRELRHTGDFEGVVSWGIGLARRACVAVRADARSITLEFPSA